MDVQTPARPIEYCFLWIEHWSTCMDKPGWASWVQAIGAVVAILAAIRIASQQQRLFRLDQRRSEAVVLNVTLQLAASAVGALNYIKERRGDTSRAETLADRQEMRRSLKELAEMLKLAPLFQFPYVDGAVEVFKLKVLVEEARDIVGRENEDAVWNGSVSCGPAYALPWDKLCEQAAASRDQLEWLLNEHVRRRG